MGSAETEFQKVHRQVNALRTKNPQERLPLTASLLHRHPLFRRFYQAVNGSTHNRFPFSVYGGILREEIGWGVKGFSPEQCREKFLAYLDSKHGGQGDLDLWFEHTGPIGEFLEVSGYVTGKINLRDDPARGSEYLKTWRDVYKIQEVSATTRYELGRNAESLVIKEILAERGVDSYYDLVHNDLTSQAEVREIQDEVERRKRIKMDQMARTLTFTVLVVQDLLWEGQPEFELRVDFTVCTELNELNLDLDINSMVWKDIYVTPNTYNLDSIQLVIKDLSFYQVIRNLLNRRFRIICPQRKLVDGDYSYEISEYKMLFRLVKAMVRGYSPQIEDYPRILSLALADRYGSEYSHNYINQHFHLVLEWIFRLGPGATEDYLSSKEGFVRLFLTYAKLKRFSRIRELIARYGHLITDFGEEYRIHRLVLESGRISLVREFYTAMERAREADEVVYSSIKRYQKIDDPSILEWVVVGDSLEVLKFLLERHLEIEETLTIQSFIQLGQKLVYRAPMFRTICKLLPVGEKEKLVGDQEQLKILMREAQEVENLEVIRILQQEFKAKFTPIMVVPNRFLKSSFLSDKLHLIGDVSEEQSLACHSLMFQSLKGFERENYLTGMLKHVVLPYQWRAGLEWVLSKSDSNYLPDHQFFYQELKTCILLSCRTPREDEVSNTIGLIIRYLTHYWSVELKKGFESCLKDIAKRIRRSYVTNHPRTQLLNQLQQRYDQVVAEHDLGDL